MTDHTPQTITRKDILAFTWYYWRQNKKLFFLSVFLMTLAVIADSFFPLLTGQLIDTVTQTDTFVFNPHNPILQILTLFLAVQLLYHLLRYTSYLIRIKFELFSLSFILHDSFDKVQRFSTDWHANSFAGGTVRKITRGLWAFDTYEIVCFSYIYPTFIMLTTIIGLLLIKLPLIGLITFISVLVYIVVTIFLSVKMAGPRFIKSAEADTDIGAFLADSITANTSVKSFGREEREILSFHSIVQDWKLKTTRAWQTTNFMKCACRLIAWSMMGIMILMSLHLWEKGHASPGDVVYVITSYLVISAYLQNLGDQILNLQKAISEMEDVILFWKAEEAITDKDNAPALVPSAGRIEFQKVGFSYETQDEPLYKDFSLTIQSGEKIALVGASGSGKSTFVKLIQRLYDIQSGEILMDGQNIAAVTQKSLRQSMALVPQDPVLFHRSLADNIAYGCPNASKEDIMKASQQAYAHEFISQLPQGYDTLVGERGVKLSGGERQRVAIARAILADCPILILDEATSALDSVAEREIQKALQALTAGKTTITIAHRLATIKSVDRILVFEEGRVIEEGTHDALVVTQGSHYKRLFEMQALDLIEG